MWRIFKIELLKLKRAKILLTATIVPLLTVILGNLDLSTSRVSDKWQWTHLFEGSGMFFTALVLPILITIIFAMLNRVEHSSGGWQHMLVLPVKREWLYFAKLVVGLMVVFYSLIILLLGIIVTGLLFNVGGSLDLEWKIKLFLIFYSSLPVMAIMFVLSLIFRNSGVSLAVGVGFSLPTLLIANSARFWIYYPWSYAFVVFYTHIRTYPQIPILNWLVPTIFILFILVSYFQFKYKEIL